jgi:hypothetical protein
MHGEALGSSTEHFSTNLPSLCEITGKGIIIMQKTDSPTPLDERSELEIYSVNQIRFLLATASDSSGGDFAWIAAHGDGPCPPLKFLL